MIRFHAKTPIPEINNITVLEYEARKLSHHKQVWHPFSTGNTHATFIRIFTILKYTKHIRTQSTHDFNFLLPLICFFLERMSVITI